VTLPRKGIAAWGLALCGLAALLIRFRAHRLTEQDSVNLALGLRHYDVALDQPHPPGYPLVVASAHMLGFLGEPVPAYVALAVLSTVATVLATTLLARELFDSSAGVLAALLGAKPRILDVTSLLLIRFAQVGRGSGGRSPVRAGCRGRAGSGRRPSACRVG
jgi:hypothetical protein